MCGIVAYIGNKQAYDIVIKGLKRLEYRGYESAGVALLDGNMRVYKKQGKVSNLEYASFCSFIVSATSASLILFDIQLFSSDSFR